MKVAVYTISSGLHNQNELDASSKEFIAELESSLGQCIDFKGENFSDYGSSESALKLIYVRTGGTESIFKELLPKLEGNIYLLTSGKSNSLAASLEILSYLNQKGRKGEILHGSSDYIAGRIKMLQKLVEARNMLNNSRLGVIGVPSDWLIASETDPIAVKEQFGVELVNVEMDELVALILKEQAEPSQAHESWLEERLSKAPAAVYRYVDGALAIYRALRKIVDKYALYGLTLRCFDLLGAVGNTGCLALAMLNAEGIAAGCEGDVPSLLTMTVGKALAGQCGFQANPSRIDPQTGEILLAHCTVPLDMLRDFSFNTHFESGIGLAIHGEFNEGAATVFKLSGDLKRYFCCSAELIENQYGASLCRTQILLRSKGSEEERRRLCSDYFLTAPIGNHHIVFSGDHAALFEAFMSC